MMFIIYYCIRFTREGGSMKRFVKRLEIRGLPLLSDSRTWCYNSYLSSVLDYPTPGQTPQICLSDNSEFGLGSYTGGESRRRGSRPV